MTRIATFAGIGALAAVVISGAARWPSAVSVERFSDPYNLFDGRQWTVTLTEGPAVLVPIERDTVTSDQALTSERVKLAVAALKRRLAVQLGLQFGVVFFGILLLARIPAFRRRLGGP